MKVVFILCQIRYVKDEEYTKNEKAGTPIHNRITCSK